MKFDLVRKQVGKYEATEASAVAVQMQTVIAKNSFEIFKDTERLVAEVNGLQLSKTVKAQLGLLFSCSTLPDFVLNSKSDLNLVDVDNVIHNVVQSTGLSYLVSLRLVADVFYACGLSFAVEYGPQLVDTAVEYKLHALLPSKMTDAEIRHTEKLIDDYNLIAGKKGATKDSEEAKKAAGEAVAAIRKLCAAGIPKGFYLLGRCYLHGDCGTDIDASKGSELMKVATEQGIAEAAAEVGDFYYRSDDVLVRDFTLAHHYYTRPGAMAMGKDRQRALQDIYKQHTANKTTLFFSGLVLAMMIAFLVFFHTGIFSGGSRLVIGIILTIVSGLAFAASILYHRVKQFNGLRWSVAVQYFVWALYVFILVLA